LHVEANRQRRRYAGENQIDLLGAGAPPNWRPRGPSSPIGVERERQSPAIIRLPSAPSRS
jgi:hypothetical protein